MEEHEVEALEGSRRLLEESRPTVIVEIERSRLPAIELLNKELDYELDQLAGIDYLMVPA